MEKDDMLESSDSEDMMDVRLDNVSILKIAFVNGMVTFVLLMFLR